MIAKIRLFQSAARAYKIPMDMAFCSWFCFLPALDENQWLVSSQLRSCLKYQHKKFLRDFFQCQACLLFSQCSSEKYLSDQKAVMLLFFENYRFFLSKELHPFFQELGIKKVLIDSAATSFSGRALHLVS